MKSRFQLTLLAVVLIMVSLPACTQQIATQAATRDPGTGLPQDVPGTGETVYTNDVNAKVLRSFYTTYGEISGAKWSRFTSGYAVSFPFNGMNNIIHYRPNGQVETEIHSYAADRLPVTVRALLRSNFHSYSIGHTTEVSKNGSTAFYVKVENAAVIKTIKVVDDEWELVESIVKR